MSSTTMLNFSMNSFKIKLNDFVPYD
jgi:hypothetical protein